MRFADICRRSAATGAKFAFQLCGLMAAVGLSMTSGCAGPRAVLNFKAPATANVGTPFTVTVNVTINGQPDTIFNSFIIFKSSDPSAVLPGEYVFSPADAGSHTWTNAFTLNTPGSQTISGNVYDAHGISGTATVAVSP